MKLTAAAKRVRSEYESRVVIGEFAIHMVVVKARLIYSRSPM